MDFDVCFFNFSFCCIVGLFLQLGETIKMLIDCCSSYLHASTNNVIDVQFDMRIFKRAQAGFIVKNLRQKTCLS